MMVIKGFIIMILLGVLCASITKADKKDNKKFLMFVLVLGVISLCLPMSGCFLVLLILPLLIAAVTITIMAISFLGTGKKAKSAAPPVETAASIEVLLTVLRERPEGFDIGNSKLCDRIIERTPEGVDYVTYVPNNLEPFEFEVKDDIDFSDIEDKFLAGDYDMRNLLSLLPKYLTLENNMGIAFGNRNNDITIERLKCDIATKGCVKAFVKGYVILSDTIYYCKKDSVWIVAEASEGKWKWNSYLPDLRQSFLEVLYVLNRIAQSEAAAISKAPEIKPREAEVFNMQDISVKLYK